MKKGLLTEFCVSDPRFFLEENRFAQLSSSDYSEIFFICNFFFNQPNFLEGVDEKNSLLFNGNSEI